MTNSCHVRAKFQFDTNNQEVHTMDLMDSNFENESLDQFLEKNDFDTGWIVMMKGVKGCNIASIEDSLHAKKSSEWSSTLSSLWDSSKPKITKSFSNLEGKDELEQIHKEQFELFNVSTPDLISGHVCQDVCICFCNRKMKQANKLRHVILMCASNKRDNVRSSSSAISAPSSAISAPSSSSSSSSSLLSQNTSVFSSSLTSLSRLSNENTFLRSSVSKHLGIVHESPPGRYFRSWKFSDDCAIIEIHCRKGYHQRYGSCPLESYHIVSLCESFNMFDMRVINQVCNGHVNLGWEEMLSFRRIQNEISVIQLKNNIINKDYNRRKWAKLEERKIIQKFGKIDEKTRLKKLEEIDYELLKMGDKFRKDSETIQTLFNTETEKLVKLCSKYESSPSVFFYQTCIEASADGLNTILTSNSIQACKSIKNDYPKECGKVCLKFDTCSEFKCLESNLMKEDVNSDEIENRQNAVTSGESNDLSQESRNINPGTNLDTSSFIDGKCLEKMVDNLEIGPKVQLRKSYNYTNRPLTRYLPVKGDTPDFNLKLFIEQAGHCLDLCQDVIITSSCAYGFLKKIGRRLRTWRRRWFVFNRIERHLSYYSDRSEVILKGKISFHVIEDVYIDTSMFHCANNKAVFCLKTLQKTHILAAPSNRARQVWMDALFTGAEAHQEYLL